MNTIVVGLGFGDEGKGATVDYLCSQEPVSAVIRYNGGCQAAHNVVMDDGREHTFAQFGSGALRGVPTILSKYMMVEPFSLEIEAKALAQKVAFDPYSRIFADRRCLITTPYHWILNRQRETIRGEMRHGSCGRGIGETARYARLFPDDAPTLGDLFHFPTLREKLRKLRVWADAQIPGGLKLPTEHELVDRYRALRYLDTSVLTAESLDDFYHRGSFVFEGAQGVLLDETYGFPPFNTWSNTTADNARSLCEEWGIEAKTLGVTRSYSTRHGAGPFPTEGTYSDPGEDHNGTGKWQGKWRTGVLDILLLKYASQLAQPDEIAMTHLDRYAGFYTCAYRRDDLFITQIPLGDPGGLVALLEGVEPIIQNASRYDMLQAVDVSLGVPVTLRSNGPRADDRFVGKTSIITMGE